MKINLRLLEMLFTNWRFMLNLVAAFLNLLAASYGNTDFVYVNFGFMCFSSIMTIIIGLGIYKEFKTEQFEVNALYDIDTPKPNETVTSEEKSHVYCTVKD